MSPQESQLPRSLGFARVTLLLLAKLIALAISGLTPVAWTTSAHLAAVSGASSFRPAAGHLGWRRGQRIQLRPARHQGDARAGFLLEVTGTLLLVVGPLIARNCTRPEMDG